MSIPELKSALDTLTPEEYEQRARTAHHTIIRTRTARLFAAIDMMQAIRRQEPQYLVQATGKMPWNKFQRIMSVLETKGFVTSRPGDNRKRIFSVTKKGIDLIDAYYRQFRELQLALDAIVYPKENEDYDRK